MRASRAPRWSAPTCARPVPPHAGPCRNDRGSREASSGDQSAHCRSRSPRLILGRCIGCMALVSSSTSKAAVEAHRQHREEMRVHERLAAGEADLARAEPEGRDFVEIGSYLSRRDVDEPIVVRTRFDIAVLAGDVAERAGIDPKRLQPLERDGCPPLARGSPVRICELARRALGKGANFIESSRDSSPSLRT